MISSLSKKENPTWNISDIPNLHDKYALITGANSGLGYSTAKALSSKGCNLILACRSLEKGLETKSKLNNLAPNVKIECIDMDLSDLKVVSKRSDKIIDKYENLDILINNAGIMHPPKATFSAQGYEIQFAVNHLSHMLLTLKLIPLLQKKKKARVVTVTSGAQFFGKIGWNNLKAENYYNKWESYANSKLANVMFALELHNKFSEVNISSLAAHPGIAKTNLFAAQNPEPNLIEKFSFNLFSPIFQSSEMGALPQLFAATSITAKSGEHYGPKYNFRGYPKLSPTAPFASDEKQRSILWNLSNEIISEFN